MKKFFIIPMLIFLLVLLNPGCKKNEIVNPNPDIEENLEMKTQQKSISILRMSDLEIIKRSSDYLKSFGKNLVFEETEILYKDNPKSSLICKNKDKEDVYYSGDYLVVSFYSPSNMQEEDKILMVYIDEDGKVLGYNEEIIIYEDYRDDE